MALQIVKDPAVLPEIKNTYHRYATVSVIRRTGLGRIFGLRGGSVFVSPYGEPAYPLYQVVAPKWNGGKKDEWENLEQCYKSVLQLAAKDRSKAVMIPLLTTEEPSFPASIDFKIAVDTIRAFLEEHEMDVFLLVSRPEAVGMPELRRDVERFLSANICREDPQWSAEPFGGEEDRFTTIVPQAPVPTESMPFYGAAYSSGSTWDEEAVADHSVSDDWDDQEEERFPRKAMQRPSKKAAFPRMESRSVKASGHATGRLPEIPKLDFPVDAGFSETLLQLIGKSGKKDSEIYNKANVSRQHFSKIRNNPDYKPTKPTAIAFAIALELDMDQTQDLIGRAGYTLTNSIKFDVIIMYFIQQRNYNMFDINDVLYEYDQSLLGA